MGTAEVRCPGSPTRSQEPSAERTASQTGQQLLLAEVVPGRVPDEERHGFSSELLRSRTSSAVCSPEQRKSRHPQSCEWRLLSCGGVAVEDGQFLDSSAATASGLNPLTTSQTPSENSKRATGSANNAAKELCCPMALNRTRR